MPLIYQKALGGSPEEEMKSSKISPILPGVVEEKRERKRNWEARAAERQPRQEEATPSKRRKKEGRSRRESLATKTNEIFAPHELLGQKKDAAGDGDAREKKRRKKRGSLAVTCVKKRGCNAGRIGKGGSGKKQRRPNSRRARERRRGRERGAQSDFSDETDQTRR